MKKYVYSFNEGSKNMQDLLGEKGANLAEMTKIGLPVPFGFTVTTEACNKFYEEGQTIHEEITGEIRQKMEDLENVTDKKFGDIQNPLLVSVRSGSVFSMPGMMDNILNLGLNDDTVESLARLTENPRFAYDSYRRFIQMFGDTVLGISREKFEKIWETCKRESGAASGVELSTDDLKSIVEKYKELVRLQTGKEFPQEPAQQLMSAIESIFGSWNSDHAKAYRKRYNISEDLGTAVNVQSMVFGNMGDNSGAGRAYTRNPDTGEKGICGSFLVNAQGEDITSGIRKLRSLDEMKIDYPNIYKTFEHIAEVLEKHYRDVQDMEFTVENNRLYMLQTRAAERTIRAAMKTAVDMAEEGLISRETAIERIDIEQVETVLPEVSDDFATLMSWADDVRTLKIRANADNAADAARALTFGAEGIGLCRTEHMFFEKDRIPVIRRMILAETREERKAALSHLLTFQKSDFKKIYRVMEDKPVTIRLLDPPLYDFFPKEESEMKEIAEQMGISYDKLKQNVEKLHELNPMLGNRGCRVAISYPEIAEMQTRAIMEAAIEITKEKGIDIVPEIMIPLVANEEELKKVKQNVVSVCETCKAEKGSDIEYLIGTMIEVPRAALTADKIAENADFFSFGTNDLTQMTFGFSKEDTRELIKDYTEKGILKDNPFKTIDMDGVGHLMEVAVKLGRQTRQNIRLGVCGDHGSDPKSIDFFHKIGLNYVSCLPIRVPIARISAAQATIRNRANI